MNGMESDEMILHDLLVHDSIYIFCMRKLDVVLTCSNEWYNTIYDAYLKWGGELNENITLCVHTANDLAVVVMCVPLISSGKFKAQKRSRKIVEGMLELF